MTPALAIDPNALPDVRLIGWLAASTVEQRNRWWCMMNAHRWPPEMPVAQTRETERELWQWLDANTYHDARLHYWNFEFLTGRRYAANERTEPRRERKQ